MLTSNALAMRLQDEWLGQFPGSVFESGDLFAGAVAGWFGAASAAGIPCSTAAARRIQLSARWRPLRSRRASARRRDFCLPRPWQRTTPGSSLVQASPHFRPRFLPAWC